METQLQIQKPVTEKEIWNLQCSAAWEFTLAQLLNAVSQVQANKLLNNVNQ